MQLMTEECNKELEILEKKQIRIPWSVKHSMSNKNCMQSFSIRMVWREDRIAELEDKVKELKKITQKDAMMRKNKYGFQNMWSTTKSPNPWMMSTKGEKSSSKDIEDILKRVMKIPTVGKEVSIQLQEVFMVPNTQARK